MRRITAALLGAVAFATVTTTTAQADSYYGTTASVDEVNSTTSAEDYGFGNLSSNQAYGYDLSTATNLPQRRPGLLSVSTVQTVRRVADDSPGGAGLNLGRRPQGPGIPGPT
ncbi:hypothetical protein AAHZ94_04770 [Streptomyces sp. HSW2009]|uniref:hypothetical protein n=1 Tax=Streptomyces sp. HSW2009 TaxID=3142890 RepID=UPI0032EFD67C